MVRITRPSVLPTVGAYLRQARRSMASAPRPLIVFVPLAPVPTPVSTPILVSPRGFSAFGLKPTATGFAIEGPFFGAARASAERGPIRAAGSAPAVAAFEHLAEVTALVVRAPKTPAAGRLVRSARPIPTVAAFEHLAEIAALVVRTPKKLSARRPGFFEGLWLFGELEGTARRPGLVVIATVPRAK